MSYILRAWTGTFIFLCKYIHIGDKGFNGKYDFGFFISFICTDSQKLLHQFELCGQLYTTCCHYDWRLQNSTFSEKTDHFPRALYQFDTRYHQMNFPIEVYTIIIECLLVFYFFHKEVRPVYPSRRYIILFCISLFAVIMLSTLYTPMFIRLVIISLFFVFMLYFLLQIAKYSKSPILLYYFLSRRCFPMLLVRLYFPDLEFQ